MNKRNWLIAPFLLALFICVYSVSRAVMFYSETPIIVIEASPELSSSERISTEPLPSSQFPKNKRIILYPAYFYKNRRDDLLDYYVGPLDGVLEYEEDEYYVARYKEPLKLSTNHQRQQRYRYHRFAVFNSRADIHENVKNCHKLQSRISVGVSKLIPLTISLPDMVEQLLSSQYFKEVNTLFKTIPIKSQLNHDDVNRLWFRFAGSSVYLKEYGVHLVVSRIVYSEDGERTSPTVSLLYGEVYDEEWNLIPQIVLVVPTNSGPFGDMGDTSLPGNSPYAIYEAPGFIKIPIFQKSKLVPSDCYGPEDPRIMLVRNPRGYDEPVIVYNQNHRKLDFIDDSEVLEATVKLKRYRSMFHCFPWQFTRGRSSVDELPSPEEINADSENGILLSKSVYNRVVELRIENQHRLGTQKNWAPFVSYSERKQSGFDRYIYFVYRWSDMLILRCKLYDSVELYVSVCKFVYRRNPQTSPKDGPGPLRGGTNLININMLLEQARPQFPAIGAMVDSLDIAGRQVWVGYARAHIHSCGCDGGSFYRPNFVAITKDRDGRFKVALVSGYVAYMIDVPPWNLHKPDLQCRDGASVLIPNSILQWTIHSAKASDQSHEIDDYLVLLYSVADARNYIVYIRGLLGALVNMDEENGNGNGQEQLFGASTSGPSFYTNDNILCAIRDSHDYCKAYGEEHAQQTTAATIRKVASLVEWEEV